MKIFKVWPLLVMYMACSLAWAQDPDDPSGGGNSTIAPKYANEFLKIGIGARALGMGNTQAAIATDVTAGYWNPAGLTADGAPLNPEVALMHASYFANIANYNYGAIAFPIDSTGDRRFAASFIRLGIDDIPNTLDLIRPDGSFDYAAVSSFSETSLAVLLSYSWRVKSIKGLTMGTNFKVIYRGAGNFLTAWGVGLDVGARYQKGRFSAGLMLQDITNTLTAWTFNTEVFEQDFINTGNEVPVNSIELTRPSARIGLAYDLKLAKKLSLLLSTDTDVYFDGNRSSFLIKGGGVSIDPHAGMELALMNNEYRKVAFLRGGFYNLQQDIDTDGEETTSLFPTVGAGVVIKNFQLDYALSNIGNLSQNLHSHVISVKFSFQ
ncbi:PorV/PorQ family protein [Pontibacter sp. G13]|uniref:putative type IX sorting system protein PorV2 n=1 Tax=Pontibacter sp. G13 TaxID=3074898 RepID=UPI002889B2CC|nr:PorV/PorQ family protein [Pontibacter sp. G13]WNJ21163.1 PorV/PorQ family protein [Pontibacter sp. G13]